MTDRSDLPLTLTEAQLRSGYRIEVIASGKTESNSRNVPYFELYHSRTGVMETPAAAIQRAADREGRMAERKSKTGGR